MILLWISIPDLRSIHRRYPPNYLSNTIVPTARIHVRIVRQPDRHSDTQTDRRTDGNLFCLFYRLRHTKHEVLYTNESIARVLTSEF